MNFSKHRKWSSIFAIVVLVFAFGGFEALAQRPLPVPPRPPAVIPPPPSSFPTLSPEADARLNSSRGEVRAEPLPAPGSSSSPSGGSSTSGSSGTATGESSNDKAEPDCKDAASTAQRLCNTMSMLGVKDPAQGAMMEMMMSQAMGMASQIQSAGANGSQQCSNQAKLAELMAGINALKAAACMYGQNRCESNCKGDAHKNDITNAKAPNSPDSSKISEWESADKANEKHADLCKQYSINTMMAAMQAVKFGGSMLESQSCAKALAQVQPPPSIGGLPPGVTLPTGATDCSDPTMASSNVTCICAANPASPICGNGNGGSQLGGGAGGTQLTGPGSAPRPYAPMSGTDGVVPTGLGSPAPTTGANVGQQGGGGGGGVGSAGGGGPAGGGGEDPGGGAPVDKQSMIGGVSGGGGGGSGVPGNPYGSGSGKGDGDKGFFDKFNLSKFLPSKKNFGSRGLAGMSLQSKDGITGPMGPSIWEKVTNQYQVQKPKMIQDR